MQSGAPLKAGNIDKSIAKESRIYTFSWYTSNQCVACSEIESVFVSIFISLYCVSADIAKCKILRYQKTVFAIIAEGVVLDCGSVGILVV